MKKKLFAGLVAVPLASVLFMTACGGSANTTETTTESKTETTKASDTASETIVGGWTVSEEIVTPVLTEESKKAFDDAIKEYTGMNLEPAALLATQVVSGTNYLYLCKGEAVTASPEPGWYLAVVYKDLQGNSSISNVEEIDLDDIKGDDDEEMENLLGGWQIAEVSDAVTLPEKEWSAFKKAADAYKDITFNPLAVMATQLVSGMNYKIFCHGTNAKGQTGLYVVTMYEDIEGNAQITEVEPLSLIKYLK